MINTVKFCAKHLLLAKFLKFAHEVQNDWAPWGAPGWTQIIGPVDLGQVGKVDFSGLLRWARTERDAVGLGGQ